ncbi:type IV secretory pathway TraG/TraD family ATPase VirD4 [Pseudarthrobacter sp. PvP004]|uniref:type IV secretory system conjugative DNA transfer family protein n=1 Tax=Pseudarthrobacter sp. PvP004 TaxID=2817850 RepID=UPI001AE9E7AB|nr:TraM recognition domain-containing protein [Pseudarthrobacter sp. PvP004]MBP2269263.1 type IV secretory pathway TraG/TraD family ATPase VirD4 [Pseudarthrobacter sp. PvP004]
MSKQTSTDTLMKLGLAGLIVGLVAIAWVAATLGEFLTPTGMPWTNFTELVARFKEGTFLWPGAATWIAIVLAVGLMFGAALLAAGRGGAGSAAQRELGSRLATGAKLAPLMEKERKKDAAQLHPKAVGLPPGQVLGQTAAGKPAVLYQGWRDLGVCIMGPGSGKTSCFVVPRLAAAPGAALMTSNKVDGVAQVIAARHHLGTVWLWDTGKIYRQSDRPDFIFSPLWEVKGTEDAMRLASWIITASMKNNPRTDSEAAEDAQFGPAGESCLAWTLLAAALIGKALGDVHEWISKGSFEKVSNILADQYPRPAAEMRGFDKWPDRTRGSLVATTQRMCRDLVHDAILAWTTPTPGIRNFDPAKFMEGRQTMILLSERGPGGAGAVLTAMIKAICNAAVRKTPGEARLAVPLVGELDEVANIVPWPTLPQDFSHYGSRGLCFTLYLQGWSQGCGEWGTKGMQTLWQMSGTRFVGSNEETDWTEGLSKAIGTYQRKEQGSDRKERLPKVSVQDFADLPKFSGILSSSAAPATLLRLTPWHKNKELSKTIEAGMEAATAMATGEPQPTANPVPDKQVAA